MQRYYLFILVLMFVTSSSCRKNKAGTEKIKDKVMASMSPASQNYGSKQPFSIFCSTEERYQCSNYAINYNISKSGNTFDIELKNVTIQDICATAFGSATCTIPIGDLEEGNYNLSFLLNGRKNNYELIVTDKSYIINGNSNVVVEGGKYVEFTERKLMRVPEDVYWGNIWDHTGDDVWSMYQWLDSALSSKGAASTKLEAGNYWFFNITDSGVPTLGGAANSISYFYKYVGDINELRPIFTHFPDSITVRMQNANDKFLIN